MNGLTSLKGLVEGVQVDREGNSSKPNVLFRRRTGGPVVRMDKRPDWFRISIRVPSWRKIVAVMEDRVLYPIEKEGYKLLFLEMAQWLNLARVYCPPLITLFVRRVANFFLLNLAVLNSKIPRFIETREGIRQFLSENRIPADLLELGARVDSEAEEGFFQSCLETGIGKIKIQPSQKWRHLRKSSASSGTSEATQKEVPIEVPMETFDEAPARALSLS